MAVSSVVELDDVEDAASVLSVDVVSLDDGGDGGGPCGRCAGGPAWVEEVASLDVVPSTLPRSLASVVSMVWSCARSVVRSEPDASVEEDVEALEDAVDEELLLVSEARRLVASDDVVDDESLGAGPGGGPGGGPPAPRGPLSPESESSLVSEPPVCSWDRTDIRLVIIELRPLASTVDTVDVVWSVLDVVPAVLGVEAVASVSVEAKDAF